MKIKGLTEEQERIVNEVINVFKDTNKASEKVDSSIVSQIMGMANELVKAEQIYYDDIEVHNIRLIKQQAELFKAYHKKLKELFKVYPQIDLFVNTTNNAVRIGYKHFTEDGSFNLGRDYFWLRVDLTLMKNPMLNNSIDFCFNNNKKNKNVKKYDKVVACVETFKEVVQLEDFEFSEIFKEKLLQLFQANLPK
jgi:hypothetical protein